jgi:thiamine pyrophosphokinase
MKCIDTLEEKEREEGHKVRSICRLTTVIDLSVRIQYETLILGGFSGRLDQTIHILSYIHKIRRTRPGVYVITDDNIGWVLDAVSVGIQ